MSRVGHKIVRLLAGRGGKNMRATRVVALVFAAIILLGTLMLTLPCASRSGVSCGLLPALFTATSATCVTGLTLYDTYTQWSGFGQTVILLLIQLGGLGFMSMATGFMFLFRRRIGLKQRMVMAQALSMSDMGDIVRLQKWVLVGSLSVEAVGAIILTLHFAPAFGLEAGLKWGVFHAVSAYCNAGFDIFGSLAPGSNLALFQSDPVVLLTVSGLVIMGGLGFFVWQDVYSRFRGRRLSVYSKLVLIMTLALLLLGTVSIALAEWNNPETLGSMSWGDKLLNSFFQSVTTRTAGFFAVDQGRLTEAGKAISTVLMLVGGSSGSTAGGAKTVTVLVLLLLLISRARGKSDVTAFGRTIAPSQILDAVTICVLMILLSVAGGIFISASSAMSFTDALFEAVSALATVGLSAGGTASLGVGAQLLLIVYMYFGRVGILTISLGFLMGDRAAERYHYAPTSLLIG